MKTPVTPPNPSGLCRCGCGERTSLAPWTCRSKGEVGGSPRRYVAGHRHRKSPVKYIEEDCGYETPCWIWQGAMFWTGYGSAYDPEIKKVGNAHRLYYKRHKGPIPDGLQIDHLCRVRACVNPDHLEAVTPTENVRRGRGTRFNVEIVKRVRNAPKGSLKDLARELGTSPDVLYQLRSDRQRWKEAA